MEKEETNVRVCVRIRPMLPRELIQRSMPCLKRGSTDCEVVLGERRRFTFDALCDVGEDNVCMYREKGVSNLVERCFSGFNATVLAYGQTGSGKTYTLGMTGSVMDGTSEGIAPRVLRDVFDKMKKYNGDVRFSVRVSFLEIYGEEIFDLLQVPSSSPKNPIHVRENGNGKIIVTGLGEREVKSVADAMAILRRGCAQRTTETTKMNERSSRSHAIFTLYIDQCRKGDGREKLVLSSKFHLVDLAGSERAKRTGAEGVRFKESVNINRGLLALGKVINALGDTRRKRALRHVSYRDSKLTRLLQDSLGGNAYTLFVACVSPSDDSFEESLSTLKYANRARRIKNRAVVNRVTRPTQVIRGLQEKICRLEGRQYGEFGARAGLRSSARALRTLASRLSGAVKTLAQRAHSNCGTFLKDMTAYAVSASERADATLRSIGETPTQDRDSDTPSSTGIALSERDVSEITKLSSCEDEAPPPPLKNEDVRRFEEVESLRKELDAAREDLRRDEIIFERKNAERRELHEKLRIALQQNEILKACSPSLDSEVERLSPKTPSRFESSSTTAASPSGVVIAKPVDEDTHAEANEDRKREDLGETSKTMHTTGAPGFDAWNWDEENVADSTVMYGYGDGDDSVMCTLEDTKNCTALTIFADAVRRDRPVTAPATSTMEGDGPTAAVSKLLNRTFGNLSREAHLRSSIAHAQMSMDRAVRKKDRCAKSLERMLRSPGEKEEKKVDFVIKKDDAVLELEDRIDAADALIEFNETAIRNAETKLKQISSGSLRDLIRDMTVDEVRACALVCGNTVLEMREARTTNLRKLSDLQLQLKDASQRNKLLQSGLEQRDEIYRQKLDEALSEQRRAFERESAARAREYDMLKKDNLFYRQTHRELKRKVRTLSAALRSTISPKHASEGKEGPLSPERKSP